MDSAASEMRMKCSCPLPTVTRTSKQHTTQLGESKWQWLKLCFDWLKLVPRIPNSFNYETVCRGFWQFCEKGIFPMDLFCLFLIYFSPWTHTFIIIYFSILFASRNYMVLDLNRLLGKRPLITKIFKYPLLRLLFISNTYQLNSRYHQ